MLGVLAHSLMITGFVAIMMIAVEYVNIQTTGRWKEALQARPGRKYVVAVIFSGIDENQQNALIRFIRKEIITKA